MDFEFYIEVDMVTEMLFYPVSAPDNNQIVVVL